MVFVLRGAPWLGHDADSCQSQKRGLFIEGVANDVPINCMVNEYSIVHEVMREDASKAPAPPKRAPHEPGLDVGDIMEYFIGW